MAHGSPCRGATPTHLGTARTQACDRHCPWSYCTPGKKTDGRAGGTVRGQESCSVCWAARCRTQQAPKGAQCHLSSLCSRPTDPAESQLSAHLRKAIHFWNCSTLCGPCTSPCSSGGQGVSMGSGRVLHLCRSHCLHLRTHLLHLPAVHCQRRTKALEPQLQLHQ